MDGKPYKCPECPTSFALMTEFKGHMISEHEETRDLRCSDCFKVFPSVEELEQHRSLEHRLECEVRTYVQYFLPYSEIARYFRGDFVNILSTHFIHKNFSTLATVVSDNRRH